MTSSETTSSLYSFESSSSSLSYVTTSVCNDLRAYHVGKPQLDNDRGYLILTSLQKSAFLHFLGEHEHVIIIWRAWENLKFSESLRIWHISGSFRLFLAQISPILSSIESILMCHFLRTHLLRHYQGAIQSTMMQHVELRILIFFCYSKTFWPLSTDRRMQASPNTFLLVKTQFGYFLVNK